MKKTLTLTFIMTLACFISLQAQKFGYVNSQQVLLESPEIKAADTQLQTFQNGLIKDIEARVKKLEVKYTAYMEQANAGSLSKVQMQQQEGEIKLEEESIRKFEQEIQQQVVAKRDELYRPIIDKIKNTLDALGKENGYTMIFDSSAGGLLHAVPGDDLMPMLKQKLGM